MGGEHSRRQNVAVRRLTGGRATVNNAHLSPPLPRLKAPAPLLPLYLPQPLGGAAARSRPRPPLEAGSGAALGSSPGSRWYHRMLRSPARSFSPLWRRSRSCRQASL